MDEQDIIFEPIIVTLSDLIDVTKADYNDMIQTYNEALNELVQDLKEWSE